MARVLVVHPDVPARMALTEELQRRRHDAYRAAPAEAANVAQSLRVDAILVGGVGAELVRLCSSLAERCRAIPTVVVGEADVGTALAALRARVTDYLASSQPPHRVGQAVEQAIGDEKVRRRLSRLEQDVHIPADHPELIGDSRPMRKLRSLLHRLSGSQATVLISGASGTGKELVARALHRSSARAAGPLVAINCAAIPGELLESELFGHAKGAFTGATRARRGMLSEADGGTLFLDEVGAMPLALQAKLARALERRAARPVGGHGEVELDVRLIAATNVDLGAEVKIGRFREDFYYRLNVIRMELPSLAQRGDDVLQLAQHFLRQRTSATNRPLRGLTLPAARCLLRYQWPGNVRELENCIEVATLTADYERLTEADLPKRIAANRTPWTSDDEGVETRLVPLDHLEWACLAQALRSANGSRRLAAQMLGVDPRTLERKLEAHGLLELACEPPGPPH